MDSALTTTQQRSMADKEVIRPHLKLLSLDGGGVRGLSSLYLLKQLMEGISNPAPKPCKFFDMIGGTSTGGFVNRYQPLL